MSHWPPEETLEQILVETDYLIRTSSTIEQSNFENDETIRRAFVRSIEIIGEAVKRLDPDFRAMHPHVDWRRIAGTRDRLIHAYEGVDYELVWTIVTTNVPVLHGQVEQILASK